MKELQFIIHSSILGELRVLGAELKNKPVTVGPAVVPTTVDYDRFFWQIAEPMTGQPIEFSLTVYKPSVLFPIITSKSLRPLNLSFIEAGCI